MPNGFVIQVDQHQQLDHSALAQAFQQLQTPVAVRSSALAEDAAEASFAGIQETRLNVRTLAELQAAISTVTAAAQSGRALAYQQENATANAQIAVLVQTQIDAKLAGAAFTKDPQTGADTIIIEAIEGLGEALMSGTVTPDRWRFSATFEPIEASTQTKLPDTVLAQLTSLIQAIQDSFEAPQDIEWAWDGTTVWLLQSRPITTHGDWFTDTLDDADTLWTGAFLNERLTQPVSPLGWTLVARHLETLAFSAPLALLGASFPPGTKLLKLYRGHPYSRVNAWGRIYKLFPPAILPADASRFFPEQNSAMRRANAVPTLHPRLIINGIRVLLQNPQAASPLHNPKGWQRFETRLETELIQHRQAWQQAPSLSNARRLLRTTDARTADLLEYHRWSLLYADLFWAIAKWLGKTSALQAPQTITAQLNADLIALANSISGSRLSMPDEHAIETFLQRYGHRFYSLDIFDAPWAVNRSAFRKLLRDLSGVTPTTHRSPMPKRPLLKLAYRYLQLREAQRFNWQKVMHFQREVLCWLGTHWAASGQLQDSQHIFALTWDAVLGNQPWTATEAANRFALLQRLRAEHALAPTAHYPDFLKGLTPYQVMQSGDLCGHGVSAGLVKGTVRLVHHPKDFSRLNDGDILVTESPDPGWTPIFNRIAGLVTARGGQLSHGAVLAREYQLPAVFGVPNVTAQLQDNDLIMIDGTTGNITLLASETAA